MSDFRFRRSLKNETFLQAKARKGQSRNRGTQLQLFDDSRSSDSITRSAVRIAACVAIVSLVTLASAIVAILVR